MAHIKKASMYEVEKNQIIYIIVSPIDRRFFVGKVTKNNARNRYKTIIHFVMHKQSHSFRNHWHWENAQGYICWRK